MANMDKIPVMEIVGTLESYTIHKEYDKGTEYILGKID